MIYELREYIATEGSIQALHDRFATTTLPLFERHGLRVVSFGVDDGANDHVLYVLEFADEQSQKQAWQDFQADEEWKKAKAESESAGPIVAQMTSRTLQPVDYWSAAGAINDKGQEHS